MTTLTYCDSTHQSITIQFSRKMVKYFIWLSNYSRPNRISIFGFTEAARVSDELSWKF